METAKKSIFDLNEEEFASIAKEQFGSLSDCESISAISDWTLPNKSGKFSELENAKVAKSLMPPLKKAYFDIFGE